MRFYDTKHISPKCFYLRLASQIRAVKYKFKPKKLITPKSKKTHLFFYFPKPFRRCKLLHAQNGVVATGYAIDALSFTITRYYAGHLLRLFDACFHHYFLLLQSALHIGLYRPARFCPPIRLFSIAS